MADEEPQKKCPAGAPGWLATFADLMSLLLAFFVLLFSFSEIDNQKYKRLAGSMREAFGVQREVYVKDPPKGTSIIRQEFSPGVAMPTPINQVRQTTADVTRINAKIKSAKKQQQNRQQQKDLEKLRLLLAKETKAGMVELEAGQNIITVRLKDKGLFSSASIEISETYEEILRRIASVVAETKGEIIVSGHTDNVPILTRFFRSNWDLSSGRAVTVLDILQEASRLPASHFEVRGFGESRPIASNDSEAGRAENRRVEIAIRYDYERAESR